MMGKPLMKWAPWLLYGYCSWYIMTMSSNGNIFHITGPFVRGINWSLVDSPHKGWWCRALMFSLICAWANSWANNQDACDLRRYHAHCNITVMSKQLNMIAKYFAYIEGILPKGPYLPCGSMAGRALLAGYPRHSTCKWSSERLGNKTL